MVRRAGEPAEAAPTDAAGIEAEVVDTGYGLGSKCFIQFDEIEVCHL